MDAVARKRPEIQPAVPQGRLGIANCRQLLDGGVERVTGIERSGLPPERLAHELIAVAPPVQPLFRPVIKTRDSLKAKKNGDREDDLRIENVGTVGRGGAEPLLHVMVVEKRDEKSSSLAMAAQDVALDLFPPAEYVDHAGGRRESLGE